MCWGRETTHQLYHAVINFSIQKTFVFSLNKGKKVVFALYCSLKFGIISVTEEPRYEADFRFSTHSSL